MNTVLCEQPKNICTGVFVQTVAESVCVNYLRDFNNWMILISCLGRVHLLNEQKVNFGNK